MKKNSYGFTLIELLVVIFIIGVLAGVILPNLMSARERARDAKRKQDLGEIKTALRLYYNDNQVYPTGTAIPAGQFGDEGEYMQDVPVDPVSGSPYGYQQTSNGDGFWLRATLENAGDADSEDSQASCGLTPTPGDYTVCAN
jgi:general secretion pathway protein G